MLCDGFAFAAMNITILVQNSVAFNNKGARDPARDDWDCDSIDGALVDNVTEFARLRYTKAFRIICMETQAALDAGLIERL